MEPLHALTDRSNGAIAARTPAVIAADSSGAILARATSAPGQPP
jgi:hypothetical protein